jgi:plastocyanin domain-containing protein
MRLSSITKWIGIAAVAAVVAASGPASRGAEQKSSRFKGKPVAQKAAADHQVQVFSIVAEEGKITPDHIDVERFKQVRIKFVSRDGTYRIRFKDFDIKEKLTAEEPVVINLMPIEPGPFEFGCTKAWGVKRFTNNGTMMVR